MSGEGRATCWGEPQVRGEVTGQGRVGPYVRGEPHVGRVELQVRGELGHGSGES